MTIYEYIVRYVECWLPSYIIDDVHFIEWLGRDSQIETAAFFDSVCNRHLFGICRGGGTLCISFANPVNRLNAAADGGLCGNIALNEELCSALRSCPL